MKYLIANPTGRILRDIPPMAENNARWVADALCAAFDPEEYRAVPEHGEPEDDFCLEVEEFK